MNKQELSKLVEKHLQQYLYSDVYNIIEADPRDLLRWNRLDLAIKCLYLQCRQYNTEVGERVYKEHIKAFSGGVYEEPGTPEKNTLKKYYDEFDKIYSSIERNGFDSKKSIIGVSLSGVLLNGSHRVSSAIVANKKIDTVKIDFKDPIYDYKYLLRRGMSRGDVEIAINKLVELSDNCYVAIIWPSAKGKDKEISNLINNVVYKTEVFLSQDGMHNLICQVYKGANWLGKAEEGYPGAKIKIEECFTRNAPLRVYLFQEESQEKVLYIKNTIRNLFNIGNSSIHTTDSKDEALYLSNLLFNKNSLHFLNNARPFTFVEFIKKLYLLEGWLSENNISKNDVVIDGGMVLAAYGVREPQDTDILSLGKKCAIDGTDIDYHDAQLPYHEKTRDALILDDSNFFFYEGFKFVSLNNIQKLKMNRDTLKDRDDLYLMKAVRNRCKDYGVAYNIKSFYIFWKSKIRVYIKVKIREFLIMLNLLGFAKKILNTFRVFR